MQLLTQTIERDLKLFLHKNIASGAHILKHVLIVCGKVKTNKTNRKSSIKDLHSTIKRENIKDVFLLNR